MFGESKLSSVCSKLSIFFQKTPALNLNYKKDEASLWMSLGRKNGTPLEGSKCSASPWQYSKVSWGGRSLYFYFPYIYRAIFDLFYKENCFQIISQIERIFILLLQKCKKRGNFVLGFYFCFGIQQTYEGAWKFFEGGQEGIQQ